MSKWDKDYLALCSRILTEGTEVVNRTGVNSIKVPSHHFRFDLEQEFPILTTKQLFIRNAMLRSGISGRSMKTATGMPRSFFPMKTAIL